MRVVGFHRYSGQNGERIRFEVAASSVNVMTVTGVVDNGAAEELPIEVAVDGLPHDVELDAAYSSDEDGVADIAITGSLGGSDLQHMRQIPDDGCQQAFEVD
jgi:hypothetical protein